MNEPEIEPTYFAVLDPSNPQQMTYWRFTRGGYLVPHPAKARYGPTLLRSDVPPELTGEARREWVQAWAREHLHPWHQAVRDAIAVDPVGCAARFAAFATCCCNCGRRLKDPTSKTYGIGPECRDRLPDAVLAALAEAVGRAHAAQPDWPNDNKPQAKTAPKPTRQETHR